MSFISLGLKAMSASAGMVRPEKKATTRTTVQPIQKIHKTAIVPHVNGSIIIGPPVRIFRKKTTKAPPTLRTEQPTIPTNAPFFWKMRSINANPISKKHPANRAFGRKNYRRF